MTLTWYIYLYEFQLIEINKVIQLTYDINRWIYNYFIIYTWVTMKFSTIIVVCLFAALNAVKIENDHQWTHTPGTLTDAQKAEIDKWFCWTLNSWSITINFQ